MDIIYNELTDLLYIRLDDKKQKVINKQITEDIVLDLSGEEKLVGIEIINASKRINLEKLLPIKHKSSNKVAS
ncbi:MAG: DUF2283 domain-containing protein [Actinomycetia bacterium]|nr:DUF2283 domain-containing protein [Actinomycetota bacterium]MCG2789553.1 DUF2283 domain-containing protein [Actinomycetes bacterium]